MSPENDTPQHDDEATPEALSATQGDENPKTHTEVPNRDESDETMTAFKPTKIGMEIAARTIAQTARAAQRVRDAEAELAAAREAEVAIRAVRRGSLGPDEALKMALDLIGRRTDIVAVQLPEPAGVNGQDNHTWNHSRHYIEQEFNGDVIIDDRLGIDACDLADLGAIFLAAASRADAANVDDAAEGGAK